MPLGSQLLSWREHNGDFFDVKLLFFMDTELFLKPAEAWNKVG